MDGFRVQINAIDHYQAPPSPYTPVLRNDVSASQAYQLPHVPVIRIFGATTAGQKFVARITLVKGVPFYGFHVGYSFFLKIYMFNPNIMNRLVDVLQNGAIMQTRFQPYEAHIQYLSQFMIDYNLFGCDWLDADKTHFRAPLPEACEGDARQLPDDGNKNRLRGSESSLSLLYNDSTVPACFVTDDSTLPRSSYCTLEVDITVCDITNRRSLTERCLHHDFIERLYPVPESVKLVPSMAGLWRSEEQRRRALGLLASNSSPFPPDVLVSMSPDKKGTIETGFMGEEEQRKQVAQLIKAEYDPDITPSFETFVKHHPRANTVRTVMESVEDLYPDNLQAVLGLAPQGVDDASRQRSTGLKPETRSMSILAIEVHVNTRGKLMPNPEHDSVQFVFWSLQTDQSYDDVVDLEDPTPDQAGIVSGVIVLSEESTELAQRIKKQTKWVVQAEDTELEVLTAVAAMVRRFDPDILTGFEVHSGSWGFLLERAATKYEYDLGEDLSRMRGDPASRLHKDGNGARWAFTKTSTVKVTGRHTINIWRAMRGEMSLSQYTMENVAWHLLGRRIPHYSHAVLTAWHKASSSADACAGGGHRAMARLLRYYQLRTRLDLEILEANELVARTREQARLLGVDFFSVISRGSQFKVESMMGRIAKPENYVFVSPSRKQVGGQNALECLPLVMEPQSALYTDPVVVLDFQSLYPSVMIAYNYCYSTFLGRIVGWGSGATNKMGFTQYTRAKHLLTLVQNSVTIAPNGMMYVTPAVRTSLLAKMLREILETRVMVKSGMKNAKKSVHQLLNNRQLALKLLANVTYGYTSASYSGRMPCAEIADSIVQTGRETLERAIALIHTHPSWKAEVVYGDTDSLFIRLPGRTKASAFSIANEMAVAITAANPRPVKIKFEKIYQPCVLLAKKRYVGYKWEHPSQDTPVFEAKGIETVRRDGTPGEQKIQEKVLRTLFDTADLSRVKAYFQRQCDKILRGHVSLQDFCFAKEVKLGAYADSSGGVHNYRRPNQPQPPALPPGALLAARKMLVDGRAEPQYGERVPYLVIAGAPGSRLSDRCVAPSEVLDSPDAELDADYYINKNIIPAIDRILQLVGASAKRWYDEMPKVKRVRRIDPKRRSAILEAYLSVAACIASFGDDIDCDSLDCSVFWTRSKMEARTRSEGEMLREAERKLLEW
ncbi:DNA polymerase zeta catalytic subunit [Ceratocystis platani]|uniref:DNA polymerase n=1 Tax=Ceratocystis fimbriata f. sp. platani TaxID=88771 RepID=A0A0F8B6I9_CERFI|nr:DNA polymerase zeta catalytic subunit [Ceratocystis platani]